MAFVIKHDETDLHVLFNCLFYQVRCWEITNNGAVPKAQQTHQGPILDCCWHDVSLEYLLYST